MAMDSITVIPMHEMLEAWPWHQNATIFNAVVRVDQAGYWLWMSRASHQEQFNPEVAKRRGHTFLVARSSVAHQRALIRVMRPTR